MSSQEASCAEAMEPGRSNPIVLVNCNQILPCLYLGGITAAQQTQHLVDMGIRAVVCCVRELEFPESDQHQELEYYRVDVEDVSREPIELFWPEATEFIHEHVSKGEPVLVHCRAGVSRSASTVLAYLVTYQNFSLYDAFFHTRRRRPVVTPNLGFMEKLCDYEAEIRHTATTISFENYKSWYSGDTVATDPKLAVDDGVTFDFEPMSRQTSPESVASNASTSSSPERTPSGTSPGGRSKARLKLRAAAKKIIKEHWKDNVQNETEIDLDLRPKGEVSDVAKERLQGIKTLLLRYAAQDSELGYCQGMHLVAALFTAGSFSAAGSYFRFQAFIRSVRGFWLPGFPLLEEGLLHFAEVARPTEWAEHVRKHNVDLNSCLSKAWLTMFTTWLSLPTVVGCIEFVEGHGLAGVLAMTLALIDQASEDILEADDEEEILEVFNDFQEREIDSKHILAGVHKWLPKAEAAVSQTPPQARTKTAPAVMETRVVEKESVKTAPVVMAKGVAEASSMSEVERSESPDAKSLPKPPTTLKSQAHSAPEVLHVESPDAKPMTKSPAKPGMEHIESSDTISTKQPESSDEDVRESMSSAPSRVSEKLAATKVPYIRKGSRVVDEDGSPALTNLPSMATWIICEAHEEKEKVLPRCARRLSWSMQDVV